MRWGNAAAEQIQHDVYGEILDCAYQWAAHHGEIDETLWQRLRRLIEAAAREWRDPDHGIWEVRTPGRAFTYSAAMCQVALDRGAKMVERFKLPGEAVTWRAAADEIRAAILDEAWDEKLNSLTEHLGGGGLDASLLCLPLRRVIPADHPKMVATTAAIAERLSAGGGLLYRYLPHVSPDGLTGREGAFLLCSFWMVDNLAYQGRLDEAMDSVRFALQSGQCARAAARTDRPVERRIPRQLPAGVQSRRTDFERRESNAADETAGQVIAHHRETDSSTRAGDAPVGGERRLRSSLAATGDSRGLYGNSIVIKGSDTMVLLAQWWAENYMKSHPHLIIQVNGGGIGHGDRRVAQRDDRHLPIVTADQRTGARRFQNEISERRGRDKGRARRHRRLCE